jgi:polyisoprenoid-binding protein YceI
MTRRLALFALFALAAVPARSPAQTLQVDPAKSEIVFVSKQMGVPVAGRFRTFRAELAFDPKQPETGKARIDIDLASIDAGSADADAEVKKKAWFDTARFPQASFVSSAVRGLADGGFEVTGQMTIKGKTRTVAAPFSAKPAGAGRLFEGTFVLKRLDFDIGTGPWSDTDTVANEVQVTFRLLARPTAAAK